MIRASLLGDLDLRSENRQVADITIKADSPQRTGRVAVRAAELDAALSDDALDLLWLAAGLFRLEECVRNNYANKPVIVEIAVTNPEAWNDTNGDLANLLSLLTGLDITVQFRKGTRCRMAASSPDYRSEAIVPFSGGVDSLTGILLSQEVRKDVAGMYVSHASGVTGIVRRFKKDLLEPHGIPLWDVNFQNSARALQQSRGFAYLASGIVVGNLVGARTLDLTECGVTMYQPPLLPNDVVTLTTHPDVVRHTMTIARRVLGAAPRICEPFEDLTKAEVMALCPEPRFIPMTHSCVSSQFASATPSHCGRCWGCLIKRASGLVAGVEQPGWAKDVLVLDVGDLGGRRTNEKVTAKSLSDLLLLLDFSNHCLDDRLPWWTRSKIEEFGKYDLYRRFSMDVYSALHLLYGHDSGIGGNHYARKAYHEAIDRGLVSRDALANRIAEVRGRRRKPDFDYFMATRSGS